MTVNANTARFSFIVLQLLIALHNREPNNGIGQTIETINQGTVSVVTGSILKVEAEFYSQRFDTYWPSETAQHTRINVASYLNLHSHFKTAKTFVTIQLTVYLNLLIIKWARICYKLPTVFYSTLQLKLHLNKIETFILSERYTVFISHSENDIARCYQ